MLSSILASPFVLSSHPVHPGEAVLGSYSPTLLTRFCSFSLDDLAIEKGSHVVRSHHYIGCHT